MKNKEIKMSVELLHTAIKYSDIRPDEKVLFTEINNKLQTIIEKAEKTKTFPECQELVNKLNNIHHQLKRNKKIKLDLSQFENYYDQYIATTMLMIPLANACPDFANLVIASPNGVGSSNFLQKELCETGIPMLAYQIIGAMTIYIRGNLFDNQAS